ncbi:MAG TPA: 2-hydroxyacid dehydrogenase [Mycobacteriales bacterium]|nr:2-hydroxyacid dehydrogenase [Mycobacteriales bacterium]
MPSRVLVPWEGLANDDRLRVEVYEGSSGYAGSLEDVEFYALPYARPKVEQLIERMPRLRVVQTLNAGFDDVLPLVPPAATLCNGRGLHDASTAEHALALMLAAQREFPKWHDLQRQGEWRREHTGSLADARVVIVGYGSIGKALEARLLACEARVIRVASRARPDEQVHGIEDLPALLAEADILALILPLTEQTDGLVDADLLRLLPDGALVVNVGRGRVARTGALVAEAGRLRMALDVVDPEPLPADSPLWNAPGVLITPHVGGGSATFYPRARRFLSAQLARFAADEPLLNVVRGPSA